MKNLVRALALAIVATGAVASAHSASVSASAKVSVAPRTGALPVPTCPPGDPNGCGICQFSGNCN